MRQPRMRRRDVLHRWAVGFAEWQRRVWCLKGGLYCIDRCECGSGAVSAGVYRPLRCACLPYLSFPGDLWDEDGRRV